MKLTLTKPIYHKGAVLQPGIGLDTSDTHGRELLRKGYATQPQATPKDPPEDPPAKPAGKSAKKAGKDKPKD